VTEAEAPTSANPAVAEPVAKDFEYTVRINVAIPLVWTKVLKETGTRHYDYKCREMAECGVVNGLYNTATLNDDPEFRVGHSSWPSTHPVAWRDCDGMMKILEQAHYMFDLVLVGEIRAWLRRTMSQIETRHAEIASTQNVVVAIGEAIARARYARRWLSRPDATEVIVEKLGTQAAVAEQMVERAEFQLASALTVIKTAIGGAGG
jgi:hypothetical protein